VAKAPRSIIRIGAEPVEKVPKGDKGVMGEKSFTEKTRKGSVLREKSTTCEGTVVKNLSA